MYFAALDIGGSSTKVVVCSLNKKGVSIVKVFCRKTRGFRKEKVSSFEEAVIFLRKIVSEIEEVSREASKNIFLAVNGSNVVRSYSSKGLAAVARADDKITIDDVSRANEASTAIALPANFSILHIIPQEWSIDGISDIRNPLGMSGSRLEVSNIVIAVFAPLIKELTEVVKKAGGRVEGFFYNPLACAETLFSRQQKELGVVAVDIGETTTNLSIFEDDKLLKTATFPIGGRNISNDIAIGLRIPFEIAEKLKLKPDFYLKPKTSSKRNFNLSEICSLNKEIPEKFLREIIVSRLIEIFDFVKEVLNSVNRQLPAGVVLTGGTARFLGIEDLARAQLKLSAQIGLPSISNFDIINTSDQDLISNPEFSVVTGLVSLACKAKPLPESFFKKLIKKITP